MVQGVGPRRLEGAALAGQQLQFFQVQGLQRQPLASALVSICFSISFLLLPDIGLTPYGLRTMVRNQAKKSDTIGGLAAVAGVNVETVRYYQRRGLLPEPPRPPGEIRRYGEEHVKRLRFIRSAQAAGFTLAEIAELLDLDASDDRARARELALSRVSALDRKIEELKEAREALTDLATACASRRKGPCPILSAFEVE